MGRFLWIHVDTPHHSSPCGGIDLFSYNRTPLCVCYTLYKSVSIWCDLCFVLVPLPLSADRAACCSPSFITAFWLCVTPPDETLTVGKHSFFFFSSFYHASIRVGLFAVRDLLTFWYFGHPLLCQDPVHRVEDSPGALCDEARLPGLLQENVPQ